MANAGQPTRRTRHMDIRHFSIQGWVEEDMILLEDLRSSENSSDALTKALGRTLFHVHDDVIMGRIPLAYYEGPIKPVYKPNHKRKSTHISTELSCFQNGGGGVVQVTYVDCISIE